MKKYIVALIVISFIFATSCRKYVEIDSKSSRTLKYTSDYQYLLNNTSTFEYSYGFPLLSNDDAGIDNTTYQNIILSQWALTYTWVATRYSDSESDGDWERYYKQINICNAVTDGVMDSEGGTTNEKKTILALAKVHRAYAYLNLVNLYAPPYNASTASTDLGLPLLTTADLYASLKRAPLAKVYEQIIADLTSALPYLPDLPDYNSDPSKAAAYALLAEINLEMRNFIQAGLYADSVLLLKSTLIDFNKYTSTSALPRKLEDPETIFSKLVGGNFYTVTLSSDLLTLLGTKDLRYKLLTATNTYGRYYCRSSQGVSVGPNVPEMMLIKAECAARAGDYTTPVNLINTLRSKRFTPTDYVALTASSANDALALVINERRRELFGRGFRWFDMRRLNQDNAFAKNYTRTFKGENYTLEKNSSRYTYAIAQKYILLNPEIEQNIY